MTMRCSTLQDNAAHMLRAVDNAVHEVPDCIMYQGPHLGWPPSLSARNRSTAVALYECTTQCSLLSSLIRAGRRLNVVSLGSCECNMQV